MPYSTSAKILAAVLPIVFLAGCSVSESAPDGDSSNNPTENQNSTPAAAVTSLSDQLSQKAAESSTRFPAAVLDAFKAGIQTVQESGIEQDAKQVGDQAVDGDLIGWDGETVQLSKLWNDGPIVLMWYRGGWCPYCNIQLRAMQQQLDEIESVGARLVVLTPELPEKAKETAEKSGIDIVALHDKDNGLAKEYGIMFDLPEQIVPMYRDKIKLPSFNGTDKLQLPLAATYVIDTTGEITYAFLDADYRKRAEPSDVLAAVKATSKK